MELLESNLDFVRIPEPKDRIHTRECCISFDTPGLSQVETCFGVGVLKSTWTTRIVSVPSVIDDKKKSEGGLFVDMNSFLAFGKDYVVWNYEKTGNPVYLHIEVTPKDVSEERPSKRPTLIAIGAEGDFDNSDPEYQENYELVIFPQHVTISLKPEESLPPKVKLAVDSVIINGCSEGEDQYSGSSSNRICVSKHAEDLKQFDNGVTIPSSGWKCEMCDKTNDLWLDLADGSIHCGRSNYEGTGGNNCAFSHYEMTKHPLAVKLGTITADLEAADVYSFDEEATVLDPLLAQHLQHFGIDFSSLKKTEMTTAEKERVQNTNFDWNRIQESGEEVEPLFGPGYTGLINLGNSCYLAAIMQVVFSTRGFCSRYYFEQGLQVAFAAAAADPTEDFNLQLTKLAHGLLSGKYSIPAVKKGDGDTAVTVSKHYGIPPSMFKSVIARSYPHFSTMDQQDALGYFIIFMNQVEKENAGKPSYNPSNSFKFGIEERVQCPSGKVAYSKRTHFVLSLDVPLTKAINTKKLGKMTAEKFAQLPADEIRPRVPLMACIDCFTAPEKMHGFYSTFLNEKTTATQTAGLTSFPDYLVIHLRKVIIERGQAPKKLDVYIDVPDVIDISHLRSKGLQPDEELLPPKSGAAEEEEITPNEDFVLRLESMGFTYLHCQKAVINTKNAGVETATNWLLDHLNDPDIDDPDLTKKTSALPSFDPSKLDAMKALGFDEEFVWKALHASGGDIDKATDWILDHFSAKSDMDVENTASSSSSMPCVDDPLPDGDGRYRLLGIVSHIGSSTDSGHYVAHIYKEGRWVIYDDDIVEVSKNPPIDMAYLYFFERIN